jgi:hypothetical protein
MNRENAVFSFLCSVLFRGNALQLISNNKSMYITKITMIGGLMDLDLLESSPQSRTLTHLAWPLHALW